MQVKKAVIVLSMKIMPNSTRRIPVACNQKIAGSLPRSLPDKGKKRPGLLPDFVKTNSQGSSYALCFDDKRPKPHKELTPAYWPAMGLYSKGRP